MDLMKTGEWVMFQELIEAFQNSVSGHSDQNWLWVS